MLENKVDAQVGIKQDAGRPSQTLEKQESINTIPSNATTSAQHQRDSINSATSSSADTGITSASGINSNSDRDSMNNMNDCRNSIITTATSDTSSIRVDGADIQARSSCSTDPAGTPSHLTMQNYTSLPSSTSIHTSTSSSALSYSSQRLLGGQVGHEPGISSTHTYSPSLQSSSLPSSSSIRMRSTSSLSHSSSFAGAPFVNGAIPASPIAREREALRRHTRNTSETSATNLDVANLDLAEGEGTFETTATGLFSSRYGEGLGISNAGAGAGAGAGSRASASASANVRRMLAFQDSKSAV